jgi:hypothetical protein
MTWKKIIIEISTSASYLEKILNTGIDSNDKIKTQLLDRWNDFVFSTIDILHSCSNTPSSPTFGVYVYVSHLRYIRLIIYSGGPRNFEEGVVGGHSRSKKRGGETGGGHT